MKAFSHLNSAKAILSSYTAAQPFAAHLKEQFRLNKKFGSKDRKQIGHLCYCFFRLGNIAEELPMEDRIKLGLFLCSTSSNEALQTFDANWDANATASLEKKAAFANITIDEKKQFPLVNEISETIEETKFAHAHFVQPDIFIRVRPGKEDSIIEKLTSAGIFFTKTGDSAFAFNATVKLDEIIEINREAVIQDLSSQKVAKLLRHIGKKSPVTWDCCAASGGKSIMLYDWNPSLKLASSDVRESILINLRKRLSEAGITNYRTFQADLANGKLPISIKPGSIDLLVADVPCSGSGTWGRTPEQLTQFNEEKLKLYTSLQKNIVDTILPAVAKGGYLLYITCSVYKTENEERVEAILQNGNWKLLEANPIIGYDRKADTMYAAILQRL